MKGNLKEKKGGWQANQREKERHVNSIIIIFEKYFSIRQFV